MDFEEMLRENHEKISKGKLEVDSEYCSGYVIPNIHTTHAPSSISKFFVDDFGAASGSMRSHCYSNECTVVDPDDFTSQTDLRFLEVIQNMCCEPPRMPFDPAVKSNYVAAFNASIISYLNKFLGLRVLVLGMDAQEADLVRLDKAAALNAISPDVIVVDDNLVSGHKYRGSFPHLKSISTYASLSDFVNSRDFGPLLTNIVANHTFTSFCTRDVRSMEKLLYHHGKGKQFLSFCGTFMDPASIVVEKASGVSPEETMVEYLGLKIRDGKTYHKIRVFDSIFYDPVYSTDEICALFKRCGWELDIYHSSKFVQLMGKIKSSVAKNLANIQCLRIALARPSAREPLEEEITVPDNVVLSQFEKDITLVPQMSFKAFPVHKNKGVPLNGRDIAAMGDSWWWGPKLDGVHCQMWLEKDRLCVSCGLGSFVVRLHGGFDSRTYLEGEIIFNQEYTERFEPFDTVGVVAKMIKNIVVFDGMAEYNNREDPFMTRWRSIEGIVLGRKDVRGLLVLQKWRKPIDIRKEEFMAFKEGIVIQPIFAPPGRFRNGFGSARYIKYRWTYEILNVKLGVIEEVVLGTKEFVRFRKDRTLPSTVEDIARIEGAVSLTELILFERVMYHYYSQIPAKYMTGEVGEGFKPYFVANVDEYMKVMAEDTLLGTCLTDRAKEAFIEMAEVTFGDLYSLPFKDWLKRVGVHETVKMASVDRDMLKKAQFVLDRSLYNNPLLNLNAIPSIGGGGLELDDVQFHSVETFVKSNLVDEALYTHWQAVISRREIDNVFVHRIIGDDIQAEGCYLFHEVPVTVNHVYVNRARLMRNHYIKRKFDGVPFKHKEFVSPSVYVQGYDISDLKGETMHERIANAKKVLVENKGLAHPVVVRFVLDKDVYLRCKHSFIALEAAISAAQLQYIGIVCVGI